MSNQVKYGISLVDNSLLGALDKIDEQWFSFLELPGAELESAQTRELLRRSSKLRFRVGDLIDRSLCAEIPEASERLKMDFVSEVGRRLRLAEEVGAESAVLPMDMATAFADEKYAEMMFKLLQQLSGRFFRSRVQMAFPVRLPLPEGESGAKYLQMLQRLMYPAQLEMFLHVHEAGYSIAKWQEELRLLGFATAAAHLVYEPGTGNRISVKALDLAADFLVKRRSEAVVFFAPRGNKVSDFIAGEIAQWRLIIDKEKENVEIGS